MSLKQKITGIANKISQIPHKVGLLFGFVTLSILTIIVAFLVEKPVEFSYTGDTCVRQLTLLPDQTSATGDFAFDATYDQVLRIGDFKVASLRTCFIAVEPPQPGVSKVSVALFGSWFAKKTFAVNVADAPVAHGEELAQPIPSAKPLGITLSQPDIIFDYKLVIDGKQVACPLQAAVAECDIEPLKLTQGKQYNAKLVRLFNEEEVATVIQKDVTTLVATSVVESSVTNGQIVYDKPRSFTVSFDKAIETATIQLQKVTAQDTVTVPVTVQLANKQVVISAESDLERSTGYKLSVSNLEAGDGSTLVEPYIVEFKTSGGPRVTNINVAATSVPLTHTIMLTFDQSLLGSQDVTKFISVKGVAVTLSKNDNQVSITYAGAPKCTDITVSVSSGLQSLYGVQETDTWSFTTRTICHTISTIGYSKEGRPIIAYTFGSGSKTVLYTGGMHGNELSGKYLMEAWVKELETNARSIPSDKQLVIVPTINPDGVAANRRNNSNNVDLNRNFDVSDWKADVTTPSGDPLPGGGGSEPMSEPETQAIASLTALLRPRLTMSYHSSASYAIGNQAGDSASLVAIYANLTGYSNQTGNSGNAFSYEISGTYDDWIAEQLGLPSVLIELSTNTNAEFSRNKAALWAMAKS